MHALLREHPATSLPQLQRYPRYAQRLSEVLERLLVSQLKNSLEDHRCEELVVRSQDNLDPQQPLAYGPLLRQEELRACKHRAVLPLTLPKFCTFQVA